MGQRVFRSDPAGTLFLLVEEIVAIEVKNGQWLVTLRGGTQHTVTSPDLQTLIRQKLKLKGAHLSTEK